MSVTSCRGSVPVPIKCCWGGFSPMPTRTAPASAPTTTVPRQSNQVTVHSYSKDGRCASRTYPTRFTRRTPMAAQRPTPSTISSSRGVGSERRVHPRRLYEAEGRRRLRSGRNPGSQGHGQRRTRPAGLQHRRPPQGRSERAGTVSRVRVIGAASTRRSATVSPVASKAHGSQLNKRRRRRRPKIKPMQVEGQVVKSLALSRIKSRCETKVDTGLYE